MGGCVGPYGIRGFTSCDKSILIVYRFLLLLDGCILSPTGNRPLEDTMEAGRELDKLCAERGLHRATECRDVGLNKQELIFSDDAKRVTR
jgi:hypothetical protein